MFVAPACQATQPVGIGSLESIFGLLKSLKIRALKYGKGCIYPSSKQIQILEQTDTSEYVYLKHIAAVTSLPSAATSAIAVLHVILANYCTHKDDDGRTDLSLGTRETRQHVAARLLAPSRCSRHSRELLYTQGRRTDLSLRTRETRQHVAVRALAEEFPLPGRRIPHQDGHPLPDRVEGEHVQHLQLNLNKRRQRRVRVVVVNLRRGFFFYFDRKQILKATKKNLGGSYFLPNFLFSWENPCGMIQIITNCC
jgi:hypothetical protein